MTDQELKDLVTQLAVSQRETVEFQRKMDEYQRETAEFQRETTKHKHKMDEYQRETTKHKHKMDEYQRETAKMQRETAKQIKELGKQIGGLGRKFGSFTEGLALPSMQKILRKQFKMEVISPSVRVKKQGKEMEIDVLAYANSHINKVYITEVKSHLREEGINQLLDMVQKFRFFFPEHKDKQVFAILAAVEMSKTLKKRALSLGFYTASIKEDLFCLDVPVGFKAKSY